MPRGARLPSDVAGNRAQRTRIPETRAEWRRHEAVPFLFATLPPSLACRYPGPEAPICLQLQHGALRGGRSSNCRPLGVREPLQSGSDGRAGLACSSDFAKPALQCDVQAQYCPWALGVTCSCTLG